MISDAIASLTDPDNYFKSRDHGSRSRRVVIIVALVAFFNAAPTLLYTTQLRTLSGSIYDVVSVFSVFGAVLTFLGTFLLWGVYSALMHGMSTIWSSDGSFRKTAHFIGAGYWPSAMAGVVGLVAMGFALLSLSGDPTTIRSFSRAVQSNLAIRTANVLRIVFIVWQGFIWIFALKHARDLEIKEAAVSTFPAIVLAIGLAMVVL